MSQSDLANKAAYPVAPFGGGLSFRELASLLALQGMLANPKEEAYERIGDETCSQATARLAVQQADDLIARLAMDDQ